MGIINIEKFLAKYLKDEEIVIKSLISILQHSNENYYLIPKAKFQNANIIYEIDILLIHPILGIYIIEVKNWKSLDNIDKNNSPFNQASKYKNIILSVLNENFNRTPINVEMRAIFSNISKSDAKENLKSVANEIFLAVSRLFSKS
ncbi:nuclease-related domain-containing protein [Campylobacter devanensis]|uniref:nuclease-related domain-containing protein n=1 Tax=Campylobacter devanensis TaxID=3161138 RepID=UPI000A35416F|nr:nuclease-related domain-containing protein [Campylobacter sp. P0139]